MNHEEMSDLLAAYALDAVDEIERAEIDAHLDECEGCRAALAEYLETASSLIGDREPAPQHVWERIVAETSSGGNEEEAEPTRVADVVPLAPRRGVQTWMVAGIAAALAVLVGFGLGRVAGTGDPIEAAIDDLRSSTGSIEVELTADDGASATLLLSADGAGYVVADTLPSLGTDRTYQLWAVTQGGVISAGVLGPDPGQVAFHAAGDVAALVLTEETAGGVVVAEGPIVAAWERP